MWSSTVNCLNYPEYLARATEKAVAKRYDCVKVNFIMHPHEGNKGIQF